MKALVFQSKDQPLSFKEIGKPVPGAGEVLIEIRNAALNHLDLWIWQEQILEKPVVPGSDGSGIVVEVGPGVDRSLIGKEVIVNPGLNWGANEIVQGNDFEVLGNTTNGTFAPYLVIHQQYVYEKPVHLTFEEAAAIPMAAVTAYRALFTKAEIHPNHQVLITGIGGGVALFLLQIATTIGASVYVTSSLSEKIRMALALGAKGGFNYREPGWVQEAKKAAGGFDVIIDSAGGNGFPDLTEVANPGANIVVIGRTAGNINHLRPSLIFNKQLKISGTLMGSPKEFQGMLDFYKKYQLHPVIDKVFPIEEIYHANHYLEEGIHFGKIVLCVSGK